MNPKPRRDRKEYHRQRHQKMKKEVIDAYGGVCACCQESELVFLTIDHIENDGNVHRHEVLKGRNTAGAKTYRWLKANGFPDGFQVLCMNCNFGKHVNGGVCPHKRPLGPRNGLPG